MTSVVLVPLVAALGLVVGSFLNVVVWRLPRSESVLRPRSACPACGAAIAPRDNVPVLSWLLLRGRCRQCGQPISVRYPLVEIGCAVLFGLTAWRLGADPALPAFLYLAAVGLALAVIDLDVHRLPNALTYPSYGFGLLLLGLACVVRGDFTRFVHVLIGMAALFGFYFLLVLIYPRGMGFGDVKLAGVLGMYLGYLGWSSLMVGAFFGFVIGAVVGLAMILLRGARWKSHIPYGPSMLAGALIGILAGPELALAYVHLSLG